ncbi:hypothetical protein SAMN05421676_102349 [Salinibacillus kushneri]|uniref:Uncharacterized protein n=1 Tax=Salinibacillus kushneri TaxID=237682 RepID=A0A1I0B4M4_9BACI|nr:hypothetical protein [Salinibacillus kushneri]SET01711.1 hypothetical protein SAMN05421676_102349 [Salinibacillus kushneri]
MITYLKQTVILSMSIFIFVSAIILALKNFNLTSEDYTIVASIIGGAVGGALTLVGVKATIDNQRRKDFVDSYPLIKSNGEEIKNQLEGFIQGLIHFRNFEEASNKKNAAEYVKMFTNRYLEEMLGKSIHCGGLIFSNVMTVKQTLIKINNYVTDSSETRQDEGGGVFTEYNISEEFFFEQINIIENCIKVIKTELENAEIKFHKWSDVK